MASASLLLSTEKYVTVLPTAQAACGHVARTRSCLLEKRICRLMRRMRRPAESGKCMKFCIWGTAEGQDTMGSRRSPEDHLMGSLWSRAEWPWVGHTTHCIALSVPIMAQAATRARVFLFDVLSSLHCSRWILRPSGFLPLQNDRPRFSRRMRVLVIMGRLCFLCVGIVDCLYFLTKAIGVFFF